MPTSNEQLFNSMLRHQTYLLRYSAGVRNAMLEELRKSQDDILDIVRGLNYKDGLNTPKAWKKLERALERIAKKRGEVWTGAIASLKADMKALAKAEPMFAINQLKEALPVKIDLGVPKAVDLAAAITRPYQGKTLAQWATKMRSDDLGRLASVIQGAMSSNSSVINAVKGAFSTTANQIDSVVRTSTTSIASRARTETLKNNDELGTEEFVAVLDAGTTFTCASNNGRLFAVGRGPEPPLHFGCRSIRIMVLARALLKDKELLPETEQALLKDFTKDHGLDLVKTRDQLPHGYKGRFDKWAPQRVSGMIGAPVETTSYGAWLKTQSAAFQVDTLGPTRAALFRKGGLSLDKFVSRNGDALTLEQIRERSPGAFRKAGL